MDPYSPDGHTICVYNLGDQLWAIDNIKGNSGPYLSLEGINREFGYPGAFSIKESTFEIFRRF